MVKLSLKIVKDDKPEVERHPELHTLDEKLYNSPAMALAVTMKAVAEAGRLAQLNFQRG